MSKKQQVPKKKPQVIQKKPTMFEMIEAFLDKRLKFFFLLSIILTVILGFYLFEMRISEGGDDSGYIESAKQFMEGIAYPSFHGTFYSIFLSWVMRIFGFKLFIFKFTSFLFMVGSMFFFYYTFRGRVSSAILVPALLLTAVCSELLYFGSQTYTEAMYLFMQAALFYLIIRYYLDIEDNLKLIKKSWWVVALVGLLLFLMSLTRNIGIVVIGVVLLYLVTERKFYLAGYTLVSFIIFRTPFSIYKKVRWDAHGEDLSTQLEGLLLKNYYNPAMGKEDLPGMFNRFLENSEMYLSRLMMVGAGLKDPSNPDSSVFVTLLIYALFGIALYFAIRKHRVMRLVGYYLGAVFFLTFVILQQHWGQIRLVVIYLPLIFMLLPWGLIELAGSRKLKWAQSLIVLLLAVLFLKQFTFSINKAKVNNDVLMKNLKGNRYYGYTPDWVNFLKMSEWAAENIPEESMIASRKPSMSFIYGDGRSFYPLYRFPSLPADTILNRLESRDAQYLIINEGIMRSRGFPPSFEFGLKRELSAFINANDTLYSVIRVPEQDAGEYMAALARVNLGFDTDIDVLRQKIRSSGKPGIAVVPDTLVQILHRRNVDYMIRGNLRLDPSQKTDRVINTVHRYMYFIDQKYHGIFSQVSMMGGANDEPAYLFRIHWDRYGMERD